ncbi:TIGR01777 family oxidoreductase [Cohnella candidum]|uniref:TIGR01777 family protein n=1 Tax=Cohnella candidum TaxID=2674991 RepID=A0A3G3JZI9_9BACL|nr:TIGR01777 family oxidoreductase [Cohnella candidum]AYQ73675.1 TIGR01777 family protein [Cohnella candidum]
MRLLLCGGTGFIGTALAEDLLARGDEVWIVTRKKPSESGGNKRSPRYVTWDEWSSEPGRFDGFDAVVNLAGESINQRWTASAKQRIVGSRVQAAERLADLFRRMQAPPPVVVNASGISLYGHSDGGTASQAPFDESSPARPADFLGDTVVQWEAAADGIPAERLVKLRIGLVIAREGGAFPLLRLPYRLFAGGRMGHGRQGMPWIHVRDMVGLILLSLDNPDVRGPLNAVAPQPVTNDEFGRLLGKVTGRPHWFPVPGAMLKLVLGEMSTLVLTGQYALPRKAMEHGYRFAYPNLEDALRDITR